ncbi:MAG: site-specific integrase [Phycisphaerae bacterium]|nr:site-specific integrase [Phycisphaerae bacterium]
MVDARADRNVEASQKPLSEHLADWLKGLVAKGVTPKQVSLLETRVQALLVATNAEWITDLSASAVQEAIGDIHTAGQSLQTCQHYLRAVKQFSRWLTRDGRAQYDVLAHLTGYNVQAEPRRERRPLNADELATLVATTETAPVWRGMSGPDRAALYRLASGTGFRVSELASLTPESFHLDDNPPAVTLQAAYSKRRREDRQPIHPTLATFLRGWLADRPKGEPVFRLPDKTAAMVRMDLQAAREQWLAASTTPQEQKVRQESTFLAAEDDAGWVVDFHALRVTYITMLVKGGAPVKVAQELARHSTPVLTLNIYTRLGIHDLAGALDTLPDLSGSPKLATKIS